MATLRISDVNEITTNDNQLLSNEILYSSHIYHIDLSAYVYMLVYLDNTQPQHSRS